MADTSQEQDKGTGRRSALKKLALGGAGIYFPILGQAVTPAMARAAHLHPAGPDAPPPDPNWKPLFLDEHQNETVIALADLIIPATDTPGAKDALVNRYIDLVLNEDTEDRKRRFIEGLAWIDGRCLERHGKPFTALTADEQSELLTSLADPANRDPRDKPGVEFFGEIKDYTIFAYYTSKIGMEQELQYAGDDYHTDFPGACTHPEHQT
jgi:glucoside 3-dehydrogenase (cytochrome c) hitch-hiker subunit